MTRSLTSLKNFIIGGNICDWVITFFKNAIIGGKNYEWVITFFKNFIIGEKIITVSTPQIGPS